MSDIEKWREWLDADVARAKEILLKDGSLTSMFALHSYNGEISVVVTPWEDDAAKRKAFVFLSVMCVAHDVVAVSMVVEAWMRHVHKRIGETGEEFRSRARSVMPSQAEDRIEVVQAMLVYRDNDGQRRIMQVSSEIVRDANAVPVDLREIMADREGDTIATGALVSILPETRPDSFQQAVAAEMLRRASR